MSGTRAGGFGPPPGSAFEDPSLWVVPGEEWPEEGGDVYLVEASYKGQIVHFRRRWPEAFHVARRLRALRLLTVVSREDEP